MTLREYESNRPIGERKIDLGIVVIRAYVKDGKVITLINRKDSDGNECLPLGYLLGTNYCILPKR